MEGMCIIFTGYLFTRISLLNMISILTPQYPHELYKRRQVTIQRIIPSSVTCVFGSMTLQNCSPVRWRVLRNLGCVPCSAFLFTIIASTWKTDQPVFRDSNGTIQTEKKYSLSNTEMTVLPIDKLKKLYHQQWSICRRWHGEVVVQHSGWDIASWRNILVFGKNRRQSPVQILLLDSFHVLKIALLFVSFYTKLFANDANLTQNI